jgi:predicted PolB exonuclease-like 3'-5' exonuclease
VAEFFANGKVSDILEYCKRDVQTTRDVYRKMTFDKPANKLF